MVDIQTDDNSVAVVVDDYGIMSPIFLYFAHLKGWSFEPTDLSPSVIDNLRRLGARYFVTTRWQEVKSARPEAAAFIELFQDVPVDGAPPGTRLIDLRQRVSEQQNSAGSDPRTARDGKCLVARAEAGFTP